MSYFLAFCLALCWGTVFLATKNIVTALPPCWSTLYIVLAGLIFLAGFYMIQGKSLRISRKQIWRPWLVGFLLILFPFAARSWGMSFISPTLGGIFNGTVPIWAFIAGAVLLKGVDRFTWLRACGVLLGMCGVTVIMWPTLSLGDNPHALYGCFAVLLMAWSYALGNVMTKKVMVDDHSTTLEANAFHQYVFSAVILLVVALFTEPLPAWSVFSGKVIISIICAGVFSSAIAFLLLVALLKRWGSTRTSAVSYFTPVVAMLTDILISGRMPTIHEVIGLIIILVSAALIQKPVQEK
ncbi:MAG: DMT family transporter [Elusimicrobiaceae bacterium]|nr:DMT family transporter [Elusimicrobiaceae bacterium]